MDHIEVFLNKSYDGNLLAIETFLSEGISPDVQNAEGETALQISAANGYFDIVKFLLIKGADIDLPNSYGWTPLMHASKYGHVEIVSHLIAMRAKVNVSNRLGLRPIDLAAWSGNLICLKLIMDAGAIIDNDKSLFGIQNDICDISPLIIASLQGHDFVVRTLLEKGSNVNQASPVTGLTPLMLSAWSGYKGVVETIVEYGGDANKTDIIGRTALDLASKGNRNDVIIFLEDLTELSTRKLSGEILQQNNILQAVRSGDIVQAKSLLQLNQNLSNYSDPDDGVTPLMLACMLGFNDIVELLISSGAYLNAQDIKNGWTALMYAVFHRQTDTVYLLLEKGVDVDICTANGYTALDLAIHTGNSENDIFNTLLAYSESAELLDVASKLTISSNSTVKRSHLTAEKTASRSDSQPRFRELLGSLSNHLRQKSKSSATSPTPDSEIFDETMYDVFLDNDVAEASNKKKFLCLSKFYAPNQRFAHLVKEEMSEELYLPPLRSHNSPIDLMKTVCSKKDKASKSISSKPHFNFLSVPNISKKMKAMASLASSGNTSENYMISQSLNVQDINDFTKKDVASLKPMSLLQIEQDFTLKNSENLATASESSTLKDYSELSQETCKEVLGLNYKTSKHGNKSINETDTGGLAALLNQQSLDKYAKKFKDQEIDLESFQYLTEDDLDEMGISSFNSRHKLMEIIDKLKKS